MTPYFLDSSAVVKYYHSEVGSAAVQRIFGEIERRIIISRLAVVEVRSAFAGKFGMGAVSEPEARLSLARFKSDLVTGVIDVFALSEFHLQQSRTTDRKEMGTSAP